MIRRPPRSTLFPTRRSSDLTGEVTFFGHTHHQGGFSYQDAQLEVLQIRPRAGESFAALRIELPRRYLLNPGSIGQPRDGDPRAAFAIADLEHHIVEFWRVPYDIATGQGRMRLARVPEPLVQRLGGGRRSLAARRADYIRGI